ncbi:tryptophan-rich sensory protein [Pseudolysinimonas kribbensis]|jgi:tryptophan-rich sensory protein|uniref:TspO/MBR-related protein n=1 Tax=Pseudolysinimonas kribbensis TaxID=433641 RepID=A0ABQ6K2K9_9MICO|nr:TspO/MBR family protein [Pseudolysinimonas kribbensis]GMA93669.1 putative TspO/MBR-related protein precursor [Pseudolysinimonas kribbensis]
MSTDAASRPSRSPTLARSIVALVAFLVIASAVAALGATTTIREVDGWYAGAARASWSPPNAVFGPVWTVLYALMSIAAWLIWRSTPADPRRRRTALGLYVGQLVLNALWTPVFFGLYPAVGAAGWWIALAIIVALDVLVLITTIRFWAVRRIAAVLLIPYGAWVLYATTLNAAVIVLNR